MELLVVIVIIGMLASMALGSVYLARESAREAKTKATITKLDRIIQARYEEFSSRRLPITNRRVPPKVMAELQVQVRREIVRMEMPDRLTDVTYPRIATDKNRDDIDATFPVTSGAVTETVSRPSGNRKLFRKLYDMSKTDGTLLISEEYSPAELLYLVVCTDSEAREQFHESEIGDSDGDGCFEFVDGWERPIMFLRWAPGFVSEIQPGPAAVDTDHDPLDPRKIDDHAYRLTPLIYSGGPDKEYGLHTDGTDDKDAWVFQYGFKDTDVSREYLHDLALIIGRPDGTDAHLDNITNHSIGMN